MMFISGAPNGGSLIASAALAGRASSITRPASVAAPMSFVQLKLNFANCLSMISLLLKWCGAATAEPLGRTMWTYMVAAGLRHGTGAAITDWDYARSRAWGVEVAEHGRH